MKYKKGTFVVIPNLDKLDGLKTEAQVLFMWICSYANDDGTCYPSRKSLSNKCGFTVKTVDKYMTVLIENGLISKTIRKKENSNENISNLYQVELPDTLPSVLESTYPRESEGGTGSHPNDPVTIPNINYTNLTILEDNKVILPIHRGKTPVTRLMSIYGTLFNHVYGFNSKSNFGLNGKLLKDLLLTYSEVQIAFLLIVYLNWKGMDDNNQKEKQWLIDNAHPLTIFKSKINVYEAYTRNVAGWKTEFDDDSKLLAIVGKHINGLSTA